MKPAFFLVIVIAFAPICCFGAFDQAEENKAIAFLTEFNKVTPKEDYKSTVASWNYATNLTSRNKELNTKARLVFSAFYKQMRLNASTFDVEKLKPDTKRQIVFITSSATPKTEDVLRKVTELEASMEGIYSTGKVEDKASGKMLELDPDLYYILANSRDYDRLLFAWEGWRDAVGPKIRGLYKEFVELKNKGAEENDWEDIGAYWRSWYEVDDLESMVEGFWTELKPLYQELHAYVRYKLSQNYTQMTSTGPIPAHLLGNMWAQSWVNIYDLVEPYKNKASLDVTASMVKQNYTALKMVRLAESFFTSIGLEKLPAPFYTNSMFTKPKDRDVICHASAWDFSINHDVRIKQCININHNDLVTTHHELGHIQYYLQYWDQPYEYRIGANPGFHEAVGDTMSLSVDTPQHLKNIGLLQEYNNDTESDINALMKMALRKVAFLPFGFLIDQWRWKVFSGDITDENYNSEWWRLRTKYQGIKPPVKRTEKHFDPGCKYHIPANTPYIRYFMSFVLQFQFHKAACKAAGHTGPLHTCSIYNSTEAGKKIGDMLKMGKSKPWPDALEKLTGSKEVDVSAITEYFKPLYDWMKEQRKAIGYAPPGWDEDRDPTAGVPSFLPVLWLYIFVFLFTVAFLW
ncbi:angiotensin-converting enzyme-like [Montipora foliosa]|uniref:angiotensin-converting enzyme-like n=1 Tax=Montipora foliosa TaxID=591990 RepID=UPI0035F1BC72